MRDAGTHLNVPRIAPDSSSTSLCRLLPCASIVTIAGYTFSVLKRAQALGDVQTLEAHDRRTVRLHIKDANAAALAIEHLFAEALK